MLRKKTTKSTKKGTPPEEQNIIIILDETGSMKVRETATVDGFNEYIKNAKRDFPEAKITIVRFNSLGIKKWLYQVPVKDVEKLSDYFPSTMTPLYDAIGRTLTPLKDLKGKVFCVIMTDGEENCSTEFGRAQVYDLVSGLQKAGWGFTYIGVDIDAWASAEKLGFYFVQTSSVRDIWDGYTVSYCSTRNYFTGKSSDNVSSKS